MLAAQQSACRKFSSLCEGEGHSTSVYSKYIYFTSILISCYINHWNFDCFEFNQFKILFSTNVGVTL